MQQPTLQNVRIRSTRDALQIFYAVARQVLPMTSRRLDAEERRAITSGNVYIWEERCANAEATGMGMERWTDGMGWGPSRVRDEFLFYHQRESDTGEDPTHPSARWANMMRRREPRPGSLPFSRSDSERLIKQTYSVHVSLPDDRPHGITRKWHLTAYFSQTTLDSLGTIDGIPGVGDVHVPEGWFRSARASKSKRADQHSGDELAGTPQDPWGLGLNAASASQFPESNGGASRLRESPPALPKGQASYPMHSSSSPYPPRPLHHLSEPPLLRPHDRSQQRPIPPSLPTLSDTGLQSYRDPSPYTHSYSSSSSSDPGHSPRPFSSPISPPPSVMAKMEPITPSDLGPRDLVPLEYLKNIRRPRRDPVDELFLRRLSASSISGPPERMQAWKGDRAYDDESKPNIAVAAGW